MAVAVVSNSKQSFRERGTFLARCVLIAGAVLAGLGLSPASAQSKAKGPEIEEAIRFGRTTSVALVTVSSPKPVAGVLNLTSYSSQNSLISVPLELPTGGTKSVWIPLGRLDQYGGATVEWDVPGKADPSSQIGYGSNLSSESSIAVLPSALGSRQAPSSVSAPVRGGVFGVATLSLDDIEQRSWILDGFAVVVTTAKELNALTDDGRRAVFAWVNRGGELLVDDDEPVPLITVQPTRSRNALVGAGVVRRTSNAIRTGQWESAMLPALGEIQLSGKYDPVPISLRDSVRFAPVGALLAGLTIYGLALGPLTYRLGKKRNRPMLLWTAVPLSAVLMTAAVVGLGTTLRRTAKDQYALFTVHGVVDQTTVLRAVTENSPAKRVKLPTGWLARGDNVTLEVGAGLTSSVQLRPGQVKELRFQGPTKASSTPFKATLVGDQLTIKNLSSQKLTNVTVYGHEPGLSTGLPVGPLTEMSRQQLPNIAGNAETTTTFQPIVFQMYASTSTTDEQDQMAMASLVQEAELFDSGVVIVVAEMDAVANPAVPPRFVSNAQLLRHFHAVVVDFTETGRNTTTPNGTSRRFDVGSGDVTEYLVDGIGGADYVWVNGEQTIAEFGRLNEAQLTNGALLSESQTIRVTRTASLPTAIGEPGTDAVAIEEPASAETTVAGTTVAGTTGATDNVIDTTMTVTDTQDFVQ
jgi:hypothetical protein